MSEHVLIECVDRVLNIKLNRPEKKNALTQAMYSSMAAAINEANDDNDVRVIYLTGSADSFCSGNDIQDFLGDPPADGESPVLKFVNAIVHAEKPMVAAVNGIAVGIGVTMLLHCDLVYASEDARFQLPFVNIGVCPEAASSFILPFLVGHRKASEWLLLGDRFDAHAACEAGVVNSVIPAAKLEESALQAVNRIVAQPPAAVRTTKALLRASMHEQLQAARGREDQHFLPMLLGEEAREAMTAFMEKRAPDFSRF